MKLPALVSLALLAGLASPAMSADVPAEVNTINGKVPPGTVADLVDTSTMLDIFDANGLRLVILKGARKAGTRVGIHVHKFGGHTCVLSGEITDFVEGHEPQKYPAGQCYYMPPNTPMSAANLGSVDAVLIDTFNLPPGEPTINIVEHKH